MLYFSTEVIAFSWIYSRFYFCFVSLNSERIIFLYSATEPGSQMTLSLNPGFPPFAKNLTGRFTDLSED